MQDPVFVHSWWRASSTYVWSTFRRIEGTVAYYEPFHEFLTFTDRGRLENVIGRRGVWEDSFHGEIGGGGYFDEFAPILANAAKLPLMAHQVPYDQYFLAEGATNEATRRWVVTLLQNAGENRAVLCLNRSLGRIAWLKRNFGGTHILLWREPAEQWAAMALLKAVYGNDYFVKATMLVTGKGRRSPAIRRAIGRNAPPLLSDSTIDREMRWAGLIAERLTASERFEAFVGVLLASLAYNLAAADLVVDVSDLAAGRADPHEAAAAIGALTGLAVDFGDFRNEMAWRRDSASQSRAVGHVLNRLEAGQRTALLAAIAEKRSIGPTPSKSLDDLAARAEAVSNRASRTKEVALEETFAAS